MSENQRIDAFYAEVGRRIAVTRKKREITQAGLAKKISLTRTSITNIEKGRQKILIHTLIEIADILDVKLSDLLPRIKTTIDKESISKYLEDHSQKNRKFAEAVFKQNTEEE